MSLDKNLISKRFKKSLATYSKNAVVQKHMTQRLGTFLKEFALQKFGNILEIGCGTGFFTEYFTENFEYTKYVANDIIPECQEYMNFISPEIKFEEGDIEQIEIEGKFDLIVSNASLQWTEDLGLLLKKLENMLNDEGILAFSIFGEKNLEQMATLVNKSLRYYPLEKLKELLSDYDVLLIRDEVIKLNFESPLSVLKHLKYTGTNAVSEFVWSKTRLREFESDYKKHFSSSEGVYLTYHPVYVILQKKL